MRVLLMSGHTNDLMVDLGVIVATEHFISSRSALTVFVGKSEKS